MSSGTLDCDLVWTKNLCSYNKGKTLEMRSSWGRGRLYTMILSEETQRQRREGQLTESGSWVTTTAGEHLVPPEAGRGMGAITLLEVLKEAWAC